MTEHLHPSLTFEGRQGSGWAVHQTYSTGQGWLPATSNLDEWSPVRLVLQMLD